jgi:ubiquinone/menaquinone biosynthesis C-methylase UbiE
MTTDNDSKRLAQQRFGKFADGYVTSQGHAKGTELDRLIEIAHPKPDWTVLDIATGAGHTALKFAPFVAHVIATDITPKMIETARAHITDQRVTNVSFEKADAEALDFDDECFDLVTCRIAPHHFPNCARFVQEGARVLKPSGMLLIQDHVLPEDHKAARYIDAFERLRDPSHFRAFAESEWVTMFKKAGLTVTHSEQIIKRHDFIPWTERQGCASETVERLIAMVREASAIVNEWIQPRAFGTPVATFANRHIIIAGHKP